MTTNADQLAKQCDLELALMRGEISLAELEAQSVALGLPVADYLREPWQSKPHQPITITAEQLAERDAWEQMLKLGKITLVDALDLCMALGVPATSYMRDLFAKAVADYQDGKETDLAKSLGVAMTKCERNAAIMDAVTIPHLRYTAKDAVDAEAAKGPPKSDPSKYEKTAFHAASKALGHKQTPNQLFDLYYEKRRRKKVKTGS